MKKGVKISAILGTLACFALNVHLTYAKEVQVEKYTLNTSEQILSTERMINSNTIQYSKHMISLTKTDYITAYILVKQMFIGLNLIAI